MFDSSAFGIVRSVTLSDDQSFIVIATSLGIAVYYAFDFQLAYSKTFLGGLDYAESIDSSMLMLAVCGSTLSLFDCFNHSFLSSKCFTVPIAFARCSGRRVVVSMSDGCLQVLEMPSFKVISEERVSGLSALTMKSGFCAVGETSGSVTLWDTVTLAKLGKTFAHNGKVVALGMLIWDTVDLGVLATASDKGTLVRVFSLPKMDLVAVLRRGSTESVINNLVFTDGVDGGWVLVVAGESETAHVFMGSGSNRQGRGFLGSLLPQAAKDLFDAQRAIGVVKHRGGPAGSIGWIRKNERQTSFSSSRAGSEGSTPQQRPANIHDVALVSAEGFAFSYKFGGDWHVRSEGSLSVPLSETGSVNAYGDHAQISPAPCLSLNDQSVPVQPVQLVQPVQGRKKRSRKGSSNGSACEE